MIARVFARRTNATPTDELAFYDAPGFPDMLPDISEVHVSVTFTDDLPKAERLAKAWGSIAPVKIGGPATGQKSGEFTQGMYLKPGYVITSRGCPNDCWFCSVPKREGREVRELEIKDGWNVLDDNLLATSDAHFDAVIEMLRRQPERARFTGGLEAARLTDHHIDKLSGIHPDRMYFAYDMPDDLEPLMDAGRRLQAAGFAARALMCYVLCGYPKDTLEAAERRMRETWAAGFMPMAMLYNQRPDRDWREFQRTYARPALTRRILNSA